MLSLALTDALRDGGRILCLGAHCDEHMVHEVRCFLGGAAGVSGCQRRHELGRLLAEFLESQVRVVE